MLFERLKLIGFGLLLGLLFSALILVIADPKQSHPAVLLPTPVAEEITVFITGAIQNPGTYELPPGSRVEDAVNQAGGWTSEADQTAVNLAAFVTDGQGIYIPVLGEVVQSEPDSARFQPIDSSGKVDLNTATIEMLDELPGIGPSKAEQIVAYRQNNGAFDTIEDILNVPGIGPVIFEQIQELITVSNIP